MNRFSRDYALVGSNGRIHAESHSRDRLEALRAELAADGVAAQVVASDLPRSRAA